MLCSATMDFSIRRNPRKFGRRAKLPVAVPFPDPVLNPPAAFGTGESLDVSNLQNDYYHQDIPDSG